MATGEFRVTVFCPQCSAPCEFRMPPCVTGGECRKCGGRLPAMDLAGAIAQVRRMEGDPYLQEEVARVRAEARGNR